MANAVSTVARSDTSNSPSRAESDAQPAVPTAIVVSSAA
jgi:hypothetical protein